MYLEGFAEHLFECYSNSRKRRNYSTDRLLCSRNLKLSLYMWDGGARCRSQRQKKAAPGQKETKLGPLQKAERFPPSDVSNREMYRFRMQEYPRFERSSRVSRKSSRQQHLIAWAKDPLRLLIACLRNSWFPVIHSAKAFPLHH